MMYENIFSYHRGDPFFKSRDPRPGFENQKS